MVKFAVRAAAALSLALSAGAYAQAPAAPANSGPAKTVKEPGGPACTLFRPETLVGKAPVVLWSNGRGQAVDNYAPILNDLASWGFVVAAANSTNAGTGRDPIACLDYLTAENAKAGSPLNGKLDLSKVGAAGHSMGGGGTLTAAVDPRVKATVALLPYINTSSTYATETIGAQHAPLLVLSGSADTTAASATHQQPVFEGAKVPAIWATLNGAGHMVPVQQQGGAFKPVITAWFRSQLQGDAKAGEMFATSNCTLCKDPAWTIKKKLP